MRRLQDFDNEYLFVLPQDIRQHTINTPIISNLYVTDLGFFPNASYHYVSREKGAEGWIIIFCTGGSGVAEVNGKKYQLHQYSLIILPPDVKQTYYASKDDPWDIYWLHFRGKLASSYPNISTTQAFFIEQLTNPQVDALMRHFWLMIKSFIPGFTYQRILYVSQLLGVILSSIPIHDISSQKQVNGSNYADSAIQYIYKHIDEPIKLDDIADELGISNSYLSRIFRTVLNSSINNYITRIKMHRASHYLQYTNVPIQQIAHRLGYTDSYYFSRVFKKEFNLSPKYFRNKL